MKTATERTKTQGTLTNKFDGTVSIGVDQSYTGFAFTVIGGDEYSAKVFSTAPEQKPVERLVHIRIWLEGELRRWEKHKITGVAMEGYGYASQVGFMLGELGGLVKMVFHDSFIPFPYPRIVTPSQLKKYATGKGNAKKNEVMLAVYKNWGVEFSDDNMADAYVLARIAAGEHTNAHQKAVVEAVKSSY